MKRILTTSICLFALFSAFAQLYFPPNTGNTWDTVSTNSLGWCADSLNSLNQFLDDKNTKAFIVLKDGKIVVEWYFDSFTQDSFWYWASAGKTMTATLTGLAQQQGLLSISDTTSKHLGVGWTNCSVQDEEKITLRHQLTMTTGLDYNVSNIDCTDDTCLTCLNAPGAEWFYHNAPYTLLTNVIESASGQNVNVFYTNELGSKIGAGGGYFPLGYNRVFFSKPRDMARFGLLILAKGIWNSNPIIDSNWVNEMTNQSQNINESYGYLWWLNGKPSHRLPTTTFTFSGNVAPDAPADMFAGLGKNDQKVYVVPSQNMVVIRLGNAAGNSFLAASSFDNQLWKKIGELDCLTSIYDLNIGTTVVYPNPLKNELFINAMMDIVHISIYDVTGKLILNEIPSNNRVSLSHLNNGSYIVVVKYANGQGSSHKIIRK